MYTQVLRDLKLKKLLGLKAYLKKDTKYYKIK